MHYKNGKAAQEGDSAIFPVTYPSPRVQAGILTNLQPNDGTCNANLVYPTVGGFGTACVNVKDGYSALDAYNAIEATASPAPPNNSSNIAAQAAAPAV